MILVVVFVGGGVFLLLPEAISCLITVGRNIKSVKVCVSHSLKNWSTFEIIFKQDFLNTDAMFL